MKRSRAAIAVFAKRPRLGAVKTRLVPPLTPEQALALHRACLDDTLRIVLSLPQSASKWLYLAGGGTIALPRAWRQRLGLRRQRGRDLGARLARAMAELLKQGGERVVVVGSDHPTLPRRRLLEALRKLEFSDVVLGPSADGGYYLVGCRRPVPAMFRGIPWGTARVFRTTVARLRQLRVPFSVLQPWYDVDRPRDLTRLRRDLARRPKDATFAVEVRNFLDGLVGTNLRSNRRRGRHRPRRKRRPDPA